VLLLQEPHCFSGFGVAHGTDEFTYCAAEFNGPPGLIAMPKRHPTRHPRCGAYDYPIKSDVLNAPGGCPQNEGLTRASLINHLFVQLADTSAINQEHAE
jgi:hypothetical protein